MRLKIIALLTGLITVLLCMASELKINAIDPAALLPTSTPALASPVGVSEPTLLPTQGMTQTPAPIKTAAPPVTPAGSGALENTPFVMYAAGDIARCFGEAPGEKNGAMITSNMLLQTSGPVFTLGDNSNEKGTKANYAECYQPTWGRLLDRTYPVMGNHDRDLNLKGSDYFAYFAGRTGKWGHYSLDLGAWHIIILNSECGIGDQDCRSGSPQEKWLKADLAATHQECIMALWHKPLFTSGNEIPYKTARSFWLDLYQYKADIILNGHDHLYERFFPQNPYGHVAADGLREFVVGTGGAPLERPIHPLNINEMVRIPGTFGYLKLTLFDDSYEWQFVAQPGLSVGDSGTAKCHR